MSDTLLIADDLSERSPQGRLRSKVVRETALKLAKRMNFKVEVLFIQDLRSSLFLSKKQKILIENFKEIQKSVENQFKEFGVKGLVTVKTGHPAEEILRHLYVSNNNVTWLVMGTKGRQGVGSFLLGSVAEEVLRNSPVPVVVIGPRAQEQKNILKLNSNNRILLLSDFSKSSNNAEKQATELCRALPASLSVMHSAGEQIMRTRQSLYSSGYIPFNIEETFKEILIDAEKRMDRKVRRLTKEGLKTEALLITKEEPFEKSFRQQIKKDFNLIVTGTHGRGKVMSAFLGSTVRKVLALSEAPVVVVPSRSLPKKTTSS